MQMQSQYELEPCPFCGETELELQEAANPSYQLVKFIACPSCHTDGPPGHSEDDAVARWNRRWQPLPILHQERWVNGNMLIQTEYQAIITAKTLTIKKIQSDTDTHVEVNRTTRVWPLGDRFIGQLNTKTAKETIRRVRENTEGYPHDQTKPIPRNH